MLWNYIEDYQQKLKGCSPAKTISKVEQGVKKLIHSRINGPCETNKEKKEKFQNSEIGKGAENGDENGIVLLRSDIAFDFDSYQRKTFQANAEVGLILDQ